MHRIFLEKRMNWAGKMPEQSHISSNRPLVSVVVPVYNGERFLHAAMRSIFEQDYSPLEVIVVNDGSTDNTAAVVESISNVTHVSLQHCGVSAARNAGLRQAHGDFISFLDADDLWTPQKISLQITYLQDNPHVDCVIGHCRYFKEPGVQIPEWLPPKYFEDICVAYNLGALLARRIVFEKAGMFDPRLWSGEDMDWFMRLPDSGISMVTLPDVLLVRRFHDRNMTYQVRNNRSHLIHIAKASVNRKRENK